MPKIHPTAIVDPKAELADDVEIGAYSMVKGHVVVGPGTVIHEHSHLHGHTVIGHGCRIGPAAYVGFDPQHTKYKGEPTSLVVGNEVTIRELVTLNRAFTPGIDHATRIGNGCYLMAASHVGHDCQVGENVTIANGALLGGHVIIGERAFLGGGASFHQFVRIGRLAVVGGTQGLAQDVPPFAAAKYVVLRGYNAVGCRRAGISREAILAIRAAFFCLHNHRTSNAVLEAIRQTVPDLPEVREIVDFIKSSKRGIVPSAKPRRTSSPDVEENGI